MTRDDLLRALKSSAALAAPWRMLLYPKKTVGGRWSNLEFATAEAFCLDLQSDAESRPITPKLELPVLVFAEHNGHRLGVGKDRRWSGAAGSVTGLLVDRDVPESDPAPLFALVREAGLSAVVVRKASGWHVPIQLAPIVVPSYDGPPLKAEYTPEQQSAFFHSWHWYQIHRARVLHLLSLLGGLFADEDARLRPGHPGLDESCASGLMHCDFVYGRRAESPDRVAMFDHNNGATLNIEKFCDLTGFVAPQAKEITAGAVQEDSRDEEEVLRDLRGSIEAFIKTGARGYHPKPSKQRSMSPIEGRAAIVKAFKDVLAGRAFAEQGNRYPLLRDMANQVAMRCPFVNPETSAKIFRESLDAMAAANPGAPSRDMDTAVDLIQKALPYAQSRVAEKEQRHKSFIRAISSAVTQRGATK
jgi:hypothetical protein